MWFLVLSSPGDEQYTCGLLLVNASSVTGLPPTSYRDILLPSGGENEHPFSLKFRSLLDV